MVDVTSLFMSLLKYVPRVMTSLLMSSAPISISHRRFRNSYLNSRDAPVAASPPSFSRPAARAPQIAYSQANPGLQMSVQFLHHSVRDVCPYGLVLLFNTILKKHLHYLNSKQTSRALKLLTIIAPSKRIRIP